MSTSSNIGRNSVLLFGDYGTEVVRLSQIYDPKNDEYQKVTTGTRPSSTKSYYLPTVKDRAIMFEAVTLAQITPNLDSDGRFTDEHPYWVLVSENADKERGKYVPVPQTLVVVDPVDRDATDDSSSLYVKWGTYTLLVVDKVYDGTVDNDPTYAKLYAKYEAGEITETELNKYIPSYESVLTPINFTAGVDSATRAVDYNNDQLMLYVSEIELPNESDSDTVNVAYRLQPDRKLMMYGQKTLRYLIKKTLGGVETVICTNSTITGHSDAQEFIDYVSAAGSFQGATTQITCEAEYRELAGKTVKYYDEYGVQQTGLIRSDLSKSSEVMNDDDKALFAALVAVYARGDTPVIVLSDTTDALSNVQLPSASYLRKSCASLKNGETVTFEVYEYGLTDGSDGTTQQMYHRLVSSSKLVVKTTVPVDTGDLTKAQITGFNVIIRQDGIDIDGDLWEIPVKTSGESSDDYLSNLNMRAILTMDDGSTELINTEANKNKSYFEFNIDKILTGSTYSEFDVLFKYFPNRKVGHIPTDSLDTRYIKCLLNQTGMKTIEVASVPDSDRTYYTKERISYNSNLEGTPGYVKITLDSVDYLEHYVLASNSGHPTEFTSGVTYYYDEEDASGNVKLAVKPSPLKQYLVKNSDGALEMAPNNGEPDYFIQGKEYYYINETISWDSAVNRPARDFLLCRKRVRLVSASEYSLRNIAIIPYWNAATEQWELKFLAYTSSMQSPALIGLEDSPNGKVEIAEGLPDLNTPIAEGQTNHTVYNVTLKYYPPGRTSPLGEVIHAAFMLQHWTSPSVNCERWLMKYDNIGYNKDSGNSGGGYRNATDLYTPAPTGNLPAYGRDSAATDSYRPYLICDKDDIGNVTLKIPSDYLILKSGYSSTSDDVNRNLFTQMYFKRAELREVTEASTIVPTHFRLRSIENEEYATPWIDMHDGAAAPITGTNLPQPSKVFYTSGNTTYDVVNMGIVIMEFAACVGDVYSAIQAVPVEVRYAS